jgi:protocatechuate 3,4-dioxygenase beta subunit
MSGLSRRQALAGFGGVSLGALLAACSDDDSPTARVETADGGTSTVEPKGAGDDLAARFDGAARCGQTAEQTEGPYYFDVDSIRRDIREDREGATLRLGVRVRDAAAGCKPIADAVVDIWHCDAGGSYSGFDGAEGETYLRGAQVTNRGGIAEFATIYPGWYPGRTVHIHAKVHLDRQTALTTQFYFEDAFTTSVHSREPYASDGARDVTNDADGIYDPALELTLSEEGEGYLGLITLDVARA